MVKKEADPSRTLRLALGFSGFVESNSGVILPGWRGFGDHEQSKPGAHQKLMAVEHMKIQTVSIVLSAVEDALGGNHQSPSPSRLPRN